MADFVAYYRVSTDRQGASGLGLDAQRQAVARQVNGGQLVAEFTEIENGRRHTNRPQLLAALEECRKRHATVLIARLDRLANRELGTVVGIGQDGRMSLKMDGGRPEDRLVELYPATHPHLDHGYAVTSHSSQGQTAERVLIHVDTELAAKDLLNSRMAYVAISRGAYDAQIFTNDREKLGAALGHDVSHSSAHAPEMKPEQKQEQAVTPQREIAPKQEQGEDFGLGL